MQSNKYHVETRYIFLIALSGLKIVCLRSETGIRDVGIYVKRVLSVYCLMFLYGMKLIKCSYILNEVIYKIVFIFNNILKEISVIPFWNRILLGNS